MPQNTAPAAIANPIVAFRNVAIAFDGPPVLQDISFSVGPEETRILLGPSQADQRPAPTRPGQHSPLRQ
jgi:ABC-type uncharacterized transport system ATPase subunit